MKTSKKLHGYKVVFDHRCEHSEREEEPYGDWSETWSTSPKYVQPEEGYPDVVSIHDLKGGVPALLVWAEYSTGDSFGYSTGGGYESIGLFKDMKSAKFLQEKLQELDNKNQSNYDIHTPDGQHFKSGYAAWQGYFERLIEIHIDAVSCF